MGKLYEKLYCKGGTYLLKVYYLFRKYIKNFSCRGTFSWEYGGTLPQYRYNPGLTLIVKENRILLYKQTDSKTSCCFYERVTNEV